jgi:hypothetical protein
MVRPSAYTACEDARRVAEQQLFVIGYRMAAEWNTDILMKLFDRYVKVRAMVAGQREARLDRELRRELAELTLNKKAMCENYLMYTFKPLRQALAEHIDGETSNRVMETYADKFHKLAEQMEAAEADGNGYNPSRFSF